MNDANHKSKILVIAPVFFDYSKSIVSAIKSFGHEVHFVDERQGAGFIKKIIFRKKIPLVTRYFVNQARNKIRDEFQGSNYTKVIVVNPEVLKLQDLEEFGRRTDLKVYFWDSVENKRGFKELLSLKGSICTFDKSDAVKYNLDFLPLFFDENYIYRGEKKCHDLSFIATMHSDRNIVLERIIAKLPINFQIYTFKYLPSKLIYIARRFLLQKYKYDNIKSFSFKPMPIEAVARVLKSTKIVLDINHPHQNGLTSRTMEALAANCKLITTNSAIINYDFFDPSIVCVVDRENPEIPEDFLTPANSKLYEDFRKKYDIKSWAKKILEK